MRLEDALKETIEEFSKKLGENKKLEIYNYESRKSLQSFWNEDYFNDRPKNYFELHRFLILQFRTAFEQSTLEDFSALDKITNHTQIEAGDERTQGDNTVTYRYRIMQGNQPFSNETIGEYVKTALIRFENLTKAGPQTEFFTYLYSLVDDYQTERDSLQKEIEETSEYKAKKSDVDQPSRSGENSLNLRRELRKIYRMEELKRRDSVLQLCDKADRIYELASRLYEGIKPILIGH